MKGSILIEGSVVIFSLVLATLLSIEVVRRAWYTSVGHHCAFLYARKRVLGAKRENAQTIATKLFARAFGKQFRPNHSDGLLLDARPTPTGDLEAVLWHRFPTLLSFRWSKGLKHHFEQTRTCIFRLAS